MALQKVKNGRGLGPGLDVVLTQGYDRGVTFRGQSQGFGVKDAIDLLLELRGFWMLRGIIRAVDVLDMPLCLLQSMKHAFVMYGLRKDLGDRRAVILAQIRYHNLRLVALGPQCQQERRGAILVIVAIDSDVQQVIGPASTAR